MANHRRIVLTIAVISGIFLAEPAPLHGQDCNNNGVPDECDIDCGPSGGSCDFPGCGTVSDCNNDGVPDDCQIAGDAVLLYEDFEGTFPSEGWSATGMWHTTDSCGPPEECDSLRWAYYGQDATCDFDAPSSIRGTLASASFEIPSYATTVELRYCSAYEGEACMAGSGDGYDWAWVEVNGHLVDDVSRDDDSATWGMRVVDLSSFIGETIVISWHFDSVDELVNYETGWLVDAVQVHAYFDNDCDGNGILDACDLLGGAADCQANDVPDACEIDQHTSEDCQLNGVPDECETASDSAADCNSNGVPDLCDIANLGAPDINSDGVPDECQDCNLNSVPDAIDIGMGDSVDRDVNGIPDECELSRGKWELAYVPADGTPVFTAHTLADGELYTIEVSGIYRYDSGNDGGLADSQYRQNTAGHWVTRYNALLLDGAVVDAHVEDASQHRYVYYYTGSGAPLQLAISTTDIYFHEGYLLARVIRPPPHRNDVDNDGDVDLHDFADFQRCFASGTTLCSNAACLSHDLDGDLDVDINDYITSTYCLSGPGACPGPACGWHGECNLAPAMTRIDDATVTEGELLSFAVSAVDPDHNTILTYRASNLPKGANFDPINQTFSWTPRPGQYGEHVDVRFTVSDDGNPALEDEEVITIHVAQAATSPDPGTVPHVTNVLLQAAGDSDVQTLTSLFSPAARVHGQPFQQILASLDGQQRSYTILDSQPRYLAAHRCEHLISYNVAPENLGESVAIEYVDDEDGGWLAESITRRSNEDCSLPRPPVAARGLCRNMYIGVGNVQELAYQAYDLSPTIEIVEWWAELETDENTYSIPAVGPSRLAPGERGLLVLSPPRNLSYQPDLTLEQQALCRIYYVVSSESVPRTISYPVFTYDGRARRALHGRFVHLSGNEHFAETSMRIRVLELAHTYYCAMRFNEGYAGLQFRPYEADPSRYRHIFSVWNNSGFGEEHRNCFNGIGVNDGFYGFKRKPDKRDQNYASIRNDELRWTPETEYTFTLSLDEITDSLGELRTRFTMCVTEHADEADASHCFGAIDRYEIQHGTLVNSFLEAIGGPEAFKRRQMEFVELRYRLAGQPEWQSYDFSTAETTVEGDPRLPRAAWLTMDGRLRLSTAGETPRRPGTLLLDY